MTTTTNFSSNTSNSNNNNKKRGVFIVFEGIDRSGKSTQCQNLINYLSKNNIKHSKIRFPDRNTSSGKLIDEYLRNKSNLNDKTIHLLFSANRHESSDQIIKALNNGINIICDRYVYSGICYTKK